MIAKKILSCARALVVLLAITMGFVISMSGQDTKAHTSSQSVKLDKINAKLDRLIQNCMTRDTIILQHILKLQQQVGQAPSGKIAKVFQERAGILMILYYNSIGQFEILYGKG